MTPMKMIEQIRDIIAKCEASEFEVLDHLLDEADGWKMRMEELEKEENNESA